MKGHQPQGHFCVFALSENIFYYLDRSNSVLGQTQRDMTKDTNIQNLCLSEALTGELQETVDVDSLLLSVKIGQLLKQSAFINENRTVVKTVCFYQWK